jgi:hypothetical protein
LAFVLLYFSLNHFKSTRIAIPAMPIWRAP